MDALIKGPNCVFNEWIQRIIDDIEAGFGTNVNVPADKLIIASQTKFNNMSKKKDWAKVDPRSAQIMALSTKLEELKSTPKKHDKIVEKIPNKKQETEEPEEKEASTTSTLEIQETYVKQFLISDLCMSEEDVDTLFKYASGN